MRWKIAIVVAMVSIPFTSPAMAQKCVSPEFETFDNTRLLPPRIERVNVAASLLHWGMPAAEVERIMGAATGVYTASSQDSDIRVLKYLSGPIGTTVTITDGRLNGVRLDVAGTDDPAFSPAAWPGMSRGALIQKLGAPVGDRSRQAYGMTLEQIIFKGSHGSDVSAFLIDGRVAGERAGTSLPSDILSFVLPAAPDPVARNIGVGAALPKAQEIQIGMTSTDIQELFGSPQLQVDYAFKARPASYRIYKMSSDQSFATFALIDETLIAFEDGGKARLSEVLDGR
jgi:hypothetical protein